MQNQNNNNLNLKQQSTVKSSQIPKSFTIQEAKEAVDHIDRSVAGDILRGIRKGEIKDPQVLGMKKQLQTVAFPDISDQEAAEIMRSRIFDFFRLEIPFENSIESRYVIQGHYNKNTQRKILKKAILQNSEKLGPLTMGQWLQRFDQEYKIEEREENDIVNFLLNNQEAQSLTAGQKTILKKILHTYDTLIADQLVDIYDLVEARERLRRSGGVIKTAQSPQDRLKEFYRDEVRQDRSSEDGRWKMEDGLSRTGGQARVERKLPLEKMTLSQAMEKYPRIEEQVISGEMGRVGSQIGSAKGSIKNWIKDYYSVVGAGNRDIMKRSSYIYHSQNAKILRAQEKQRLSFVLKSLEGNIPIMIDPNKEEIVFNRETSDMRQSIRGGQVPSYGDAEQARRSKMSFYSDDEVDDIKHRSSNVNQVTRNEKTKINEVQGNRFDLKSDHFRDVTENKSGIADKLLKNKQKEDFRRASDNEKNVRFSNPQQFSVEKKENENSNFGRIKPIE